MALMALVESQQQEAPAAWEGAGESEAPPRLLRSVESGSPPRPREGQRKRRWPDAIDVIFEKDPAALNIFEALLYQGLHAILLHRVSHALYRARIPILPRFISQIGRLLTGGIEIHPGAQ